MKWWRKKHGTLWTTAEAKKIGERADSDAANGSLWVAHTMASKGDQVARGGVTASALATARASRRPPRRRPGPAPDFVALYQERRRLIVGKVGEDEARLRALEYVAGLAARHYGCDLQAAANLVLDKLKQKS